MYSACLISIAIDAYIYIYIFFYAEEGYSILTLTSKTTLASDNKHFNILKLAWVSFMNEEHHKGNPCHGISGMETDLFNDKKRLILDDF